MYLTNIKKMIRKQINALERYMIFSLIRETEFYNREMVYSTHYRETNAYFDSLLDMVIYKTDCIK